MSRPRTATILAPTTSDGSAAHRYSAFREVTLQFTSARHVIRPRSVPVLATSSATSCIGARHVIYPHIVPVHPRTLAASSSLA
jgi:hypothetical protein